MSTLVLMFVQLLASLGAPVAICNQQPVLTRGASSTCQAPAPPPPRFMVEHSEISNGF